MVVHHSSPALPAVPVAFRDGSPNGASPGTVAAFTASQRVEAEEICLTGLTLGPDCVGRAETLTRHLFTKAPATVACCQGIKIKRYHVSSRHYLASSRTAPTARVSRSFQEVQEQCFAFPSLWTLLSIFFI
jgi:hypothetical protein